MAPLGGGGAVCQVTIATQGRLPMKPEEGSKLQRMKKCLFKRQIHSDMNVKRVCGGGRSLVGVFKLPLGFLLKLETAAASLLANERP